MHLLWVSFKIQVFAEDGSSVELVPLTREHFVSRLTQENKLTCKLIRDIVQPLMVTSFQTT